MCLGDLTAFPGNATPWNQQPFPMNLMCFGSPGPTSRTQHLYFSNVCSWLWCAGAVSVWPENAKPSIVHLEMIFNDFDAFGWSQSLSRDHSQNFSFRIAPEWIQWVWVNQGLPRERSTFTLAMNFNEFDVLGWSHVLSTGRNTFSLAMNLNEFEVFGWSHGLSRERKTRELV